MFWKIKNYAWMSQTGLVPFCVFKFCKMDPDFGNKQNSQMFFLGTKGT
jgi:hypothetical protein